MSEHIDYINQVSGKLQQLLKEYAILKKENSRLLDELSAAGMQQQAAKASIAQLEQQVGVLKAAAGNMSESDKKDFESRLNKYIKEIDATIAMLGG